MPDKYHGGVPMDRLKPAKELFSTFEPVETPGPTAAARRVGVFIRLFVLTRTLLAEHTSLWKVRRWRMHRLALRIARVKQRGRMRRIELALNLIRGGQPRHRRQMAGFNVDQLMAIARATGATMMADPQVPGMTSIANPTGAFQNTVQAAPTQDQYTLALAGLGVDLPTHNSSSVDDGARINTIMAASPAGSVFTFSPGTTYTIGTGINAPSNAVVIAYGATIEALAGTNTSNLLNIVGSGSGSNPFVSSVLVYGGTWDGNKANVTYPGIQYIYGNAINVQWARNCVIEPQFVQNCIAEGIFMGATPCSHNYIKTIARYNHDCGIFLHIGVCDTMVDGSFAYENNFGGIIGIRSDQIMFRGSFSHSNGTAHTTEGSGFDFQGCLNSKMEGCYAWQNSNHDFESSNTAEGSGGGTISWTAEGAWSSSSTYAVGQTVTYLGTTWYCYVAAGAGVVPEQQSANWCAAGGMATASSAEVYSQNCEINNCSSLNPGALTSNGTYSSTASYAIDNTVLSSGTVYICIAATTGNAPPNGTYWVAAPNPVGMAIYKTSSLTVNNFKSNAAFNGVLMQYGVSDIVFNNLRLSGSSDTGFKWYYSVLSCNTNSTTTVTIATTGNAAFLGVGDYVTGSGIPNGTTVSTVNLTAGTITISNSASTSVSGTNLTFWPAGTVTLNDPQIIGCGTGNLPGLYGYGCDLRVNGGEITGSGAAGVQCAAVGQAETWWIFDGTEIHDNGTQSLANGFLWGPSTAGPNYLYYKIVNCKAINMTAAGSIGQYRLGYESAQCNGIVSRCTTRNQSGDYAIDANTTVFAGDNDFGLNPDNLSGTGTLSAATTTAVAFAKTMVAAPDAAGIKVTFTGNPGITAGQYWLTSISATGFTINFAASAAAVGYAYTARTGV